MNRIETIKLYIKVACQSQSYSFNYIYFYKIKINNYTVKINKIHRMNESKPMNWIIIIKLSYKIQIELLAFLEFVYNNINETMVIIANPPNIFGIFLEDIVESAISRRPKSESFVALCVLLIV